MFRFLARFLGIWLIAAALVMAVVDGARSIAASRLVLTPLSETSASLAALGGSDTESVAPLPAPLPWPLDIARVWLVAVPTVLVLAVPGVLLLVAGRKRRRFSLSREYAT